MKYDKLLRHINKFCILSYLSGIGLFVFFNHEDQSEKCYFSENALLPGLVKLQHSPLEKEMQLFSRNCKISSDDNESVTTLLQNHGIEYHEQKFQFQRNFIGSTKEYVNGTNIYGIVRAMRSGSTESIVINIPMKDDNINYACGVSIVFGGLARNEMFWAKDIIILFSQHGSHGVRAWLDMYHGMTTSYVSANQLPSRAGSIQAAVILELPAKEASYINLKLEGRNGQLPNLDLVNLVVRLSQMNRIPVSINHQFPPYSSSKVENLEQYLTTSLSMMKQLASGKSSGNHGEFLIYNIPALTLEGVYNNKWIGVRLKVIEKVLNGICRSLNNLLERFHQSFFFYFLPSNERYISISMFMPCFGLVLIPAVVKALSLLVDTNQDRNPNKVESEVKENEELDKLLKESGSNFAESPSISYEYSKWYPVFAIIALSHLTGVILFSSPTFTSVWSEMYQISLETSFVLLHIFVCLLGLGLVSTLRISPAAALTLRVVSLLQISIILGTLAITNFSFGYVSSILAVPPLLLISHHTGRIQYLSKILVLIASPITFCLIVFKNFDDFVDVYNWHATNQSMLYSVSVLLFFPLWLQLWAVTNAAHPEDLKLKKE